MDICRFVQYENSVLPVIIATGTFEEIEEYASSNGYHKNNPFLYETHPKFFKGDYDAALGNENVFKYAVILEEHESVVSCDESIDAMLNTICEINWSINTTEGMNGISDEVIYCTQLIFTSDGYNHKIHYLGIEVYCSDNDERIYHEEIDNYEMFETYLKRKIFEVHQTFNKIEFIKKLNA